MQPSNQEKRMVAKAEAALVNGTLSEGPISEDVSPRIERENEKIPNEPKTVKSHHLFDL